jgi:hypothetical protein
MRDHVPPDATAQRIEPAEVLFRRRNVRQWTDLPDHHVKRLMRQLEHLEYLVTSRRGNGSSHRYRLVETESAEKSVEGLMTPEELAGQIGSVNANDLRQKRDRTGTAPRQTAEVLSQP